MDLEQTETILKRLELGEPLSRICKDKDLPDVSTVYKHCRKDEKLQKKIMRWDYEPSKHYFGRKRK